MAEKFAVCQLSDGLVINAIMAEPGDEAQNGCQLVPVGEQWCDIGYVWNGSQFIPPEPVE